MVRSRIGFFVSICFFGRGDFCHSIRCPAIRSVAVQNGLCRMPPGSPGEGNGQLERRCEPPTLIHHSDRGSRYVSIRYSERLIRESIKPSVGSVGDSYDNALAESLIGLYKAELVHRRGPWKSGRALELATLHWVSWFNEHRLLEPIGYIPPAEAETNYFRNRGDQALAA